MVQMAKPAHTPYNNGICAGFTLEVCCGRATKGIVT